MMKLIRSLEKQYSDLSVGGIKEMRRKMILLITLFWLYGRMVLFSPLLLIIRIIKPIVLIRIGRLHSRRIGHFAANTELVILESRRGINNPSKKYFDLFFLEKGNSSNSFLTKKWKEKLIILPTLILDPIYQLILIFPGAKDHQILPSNHDRDIHNLIEDSPPSITFNQQEIELGEAGIKDLGVLPHKPFVCLIVRDNAYLNMHLKPKDKETYSYHNYRDCDIKSYLLTAEELTQKGYYVVRMGVIVKEALVSNNPMIIDYANSGKRTEFMDVYLGAKCDFCISSGLGWDTIPTHLFRKPCLYAPMLPIGYFPTYITQTLLITKVHYSRQLKRNLTMSEIADLGLDLALSSNDFIDQNVDLIEPSPKDIWEAAQEMIEMVEGKGNYSEDDENLQKKFWKLYANKTINTTSLHGQLRAKIGKSFLQNNKDWLLK